MPKYNNAGEQLGSTGGTKATPFASGLAAAGAVANAKAYHGVLVTALGTAALSIHHGTDNSGPIIGYIAASTAAGTPQMLGGVDCPNGVYVNCVANSPAVTVFTSP